MDALENISPIDGRYRGYTEILSRYFSEKAFMRYRIMAEGEYLITLSENFHIGLRRFTSAEKKRVRNLYELTTKDANIIRDIERKGYGGIPATNHDLKAIEYFLKLKLKNTSLRRATEWIHFGLTSEDATNLAYALMLSDALANVVVPTLSRVEAALRALSRAHAGIPMLARTHGQPASPTTFGKEMNFFRMRLNRQFGQLKQFRILAKLNGATGNYNALVAAYPKIDWIAFSKKFIGVFNKNRFIKLEPNLVTTQIEPHDTYAELFDILRRTNTILLGLNQDIWRYVSDGWLAQKSVKGEVGSSTMPHKINPWFFENSEGNLGTANALFGFFSAKLPISRLQRDLSDSTSMRNFGTAFGHCLIGYEYLLKGLARVHVDRDVIGSALKHHPEVITEAIQTVLRREGVAMPYEKLKELTRGREVTLLDLREFIETLPLRPTTKNELKKITPENYIGLAKKLARK